MAFVAHDILGPHTRLPDAGGDRAPQNQVGAEHSALAHLCARFKEAALPVPPGLVREEGGWGVGDSAVQSELLSVSLGGLADVLEPAGDEQASAERPEPALPLKLPEVRRHHAGRREPSQRRSPVLGRAVSLGTTSWRRAYRCASLDAAL